MAILNEGIRKAAMWAPIQFKRDRPNEDLRLPSVIIFGRLQQLIEFFGQVTKEDLEWRFPSQTFPGTPI